MKAIATSILFAGFTYAFVQTYRWTGADSIFCMVSLVMSIIFFAVTLKHLFKNE